MAIKSPLSPPLSVAFGAVLLLAAFFFGEKQYLLLQDGVHIAGTISRMHLQEETENGRPCCKYYPVIEFNDSSGDKVTFTAEKGSTRADKYQEGQSIPVVYLKEDPATTAQIDTGYDAMGVPAIFALFGILFLRGGLPKQQNEAL